MSKSSTWERALPLDQPPESARLAKDKPPSPLAVHLVLNPPSVNETATVSLTDAITGSKQFINELNSGVRCLTVSSNLGFRRKR